MRLDDSTPGLLLFDDQPGGLRFVPLLFVVAGTIGAIASIGSGIRAEVGPLTALIGAVGSIAAVAVGIGVWRATPATRVRFDLRRRQLQVFRSRHADDGLASGFDAVDDIVVAQDRDIDGDPVFRLSLQLRDGRAIPLSLHWRADREAHDVIAQRLRRACRDGISND